MQIEMFGFLPRQRSLIDIMERFEESGLFSVNSVSSVCLCSKYFSIRDLQSGWRFGRHFILKSIIEM